MPCSCFGRAAALLLLAAAIAGCRDSTGPSAEPPGVGFSYSAPGAQNISFRAQGTPTFTGGVLQHGTWAAGGWGATSGDIIVMALQGDGAGLGELFYLDVYDVAGPESDLVIDGERAYVEVSRNFDIGTFMADQYCVIWSGTLNITEITDARMRGSFSGEGVCYDLFNVEVGAVSVSNGTFDVPVIGEFSEVLD